MPIKILSEETINKIAAGEVIERPANVLKELIENSIDAKSKSIEIEIKDSGKELIRITDDGIGMSRQDLTLSITRHATSKISEFDDLETLSTLGFRGEALPSIASVSHMVLQSMPKGEASGWEIKLSGGKLTESRMWAGKPGTNIEISKLFFNTPARNKFLKAATTERHHIIQTIEEAALVNTGIAFKAISDGKTIVNAPAVKNKVERIFDILGKDFARKLISVEVKHAKIKITAYITKTEDSLSNRNSQFLFVNNRPVRLTKTITHAVYEAYRENLAVGRHPGVIIFLEIDPALIDVNIHPAKREIKISNESELHDLLYRSIKEALIRPIDVYLTKPQDSAKPSYTVSEKPVMNSYASFKARSAIKDMQTAIKDQDFLSTILDDESAIKALGQVFNLFIIAQDKDEVLIVDQHAAAERIRYEQYKKQWETKKIPVQPLLIPLTIELPKSRMELIADNQKLLSETGWGIEEFGKNTIRISQQPNILGSDNYVKEVIDEILNALAEGSKLPPAEKIEKVIRSACRASIKANEPLSTIEMTEVINKLLKCAAPYTCPHGRPTMIRLSRNELKKKFNRT